MKGIFELEPALPKYSEIWGDTIVLEYFRTADDFNSTSLEALTLNWTLLLCLITGQRGQSLDKFDVDFIQEMDDSYRITVCEKLKQTKPLAPIDLLT